MSGASLREVAEILGHRSLKQTMKYIHLMEPHTRGVLQRMITQHLDGVLGAPCPHLSQGGASHDHQER
jgi:hypothetical protein